MGIRTGPPNPPPTPPPRPKPGTIVPVKNHQEAFQVAKLMRERDLPIVKRKGNFAAMACGPEGTTLWLCTESDEIIKVFFKDKKLADSLYCEDVEVSIKVLKKG